MYEAILSVFAEKIELYAPGEAAFWDDPHISKGMLEAHLNPEWDAASRKLDFIDRSVEWITGVCDGGQGKALLDLGCGPGLYDERFAHKGFRVTGVDLSHRSIDYARQSAQKQGLAIRYERANYLDIAYAAEFDAAVLIYFDYGVLCPEDRKQVLKNARAALVPGGLFFVDGIGMGQKAKIHENCSAEYRESGFWTDEPHVIVSKSVWYPETLNTLDRHVVITADSVKRYNNWNQLYTPESLGAELREAGFSDIRFFGDIAGAEYQPNGDAICAVARA